MASRLPQRLLGILALMVVMALAAPAFAQDSDRETAEKVLLIVKNANDEFDRGEYDDALRLYQEAYDLYPEAVLLYRIGVAAEKTGDTRRAVEAYEAYVDASAEDDPTARKLAEEIPKLRATLPPRVTVETTPAGAGVYLDSLDSEPLGVTPGTFELPGNEVELIVRLEGYSVERRELSLENGEEETVTLELEELQRLATTDPEEPPPTDDTDSLNLAIWGWAATGLGVALLGTGATFAILSSSATNDVNTYDKRAPDATRAELDSLKETATSRYKTSVATFIAGGVSV